MVTEVYRYFAGKKASFSAKGIIISVNTIGVIGFIVWAHHMYTVGMNGNSKTYFMIVTMFIAVPTGVKVFS